MTDISASLGSSLVTGLLASLSYPIVLRFEDRAFVEELRGADVEVDVQSRQQSDQALDLDAHERGDALLDAAVEAFVRVAKKSAIDTQNDEGVELLKPLFEGYSVDTTLSEEAAREKLRADIEAGSQERFSKRFGTYLRGVSFSVKWVEVEVSSRPGASLGNPLKIQNLRLRIRAKVEGCIKVLGQKFCATVTSPWVILEGREVAVELIDAGLQVRAEATASDIDIVIRIKIWKWHYDIKIGITKIVNSFLKKQAPVVLDLSKVELDIPRLNRTYRPKTIDVPSHPSTTTINIDGSFTPS